METAKSPEGFYEGCQIGKFSPEQVSNELQLKLANLN